MRDLLTRSLVLLFATAMLTSVIVNRMNNINAMNATENPLLDKWEGPYGGVPPFDRVQIALFKPALEAAMAEQLTETDRIAKNPAAPDFENTIAAAERSGQTLNRVSTLYGVWAAKSKLTAEQQRLIWLYYTNFVRAGARLNPDLKRA